MVRFSNLCDIDVIIHSTGKCLSINNFLESDKCSLGRGCRLLKIGRKISKQFSYILLLSCFIFLLYLVLSPSIYCKTDGYISCMGVSDRMADGSAPIKYKNQVYYIITAFTANEFFTEAISGRMANRTAQNFRQLLRVVLYIFAAMLSGFGILIHYRKCFLCRTGQLASILALSKGGHAPPRKCFI